MTVTNFPMVQVQQLHEDHLHAASKLLFDCWHDCYRSVLPTRIVDQRDPAFFQHYLKTKIGVAWSARLGTKTVGVITVSANCIDELWVDGKHRRRGIGTRLVAMALEHFKARGFSNAQVGIENFNQGPLHFFKAKGWANIGSEFITIDTDRHVEALVYSTALSA